MAFFAALIVVVFSFAFVKDQQALVATAVARHGVGRRCVFAGTIGLGRAFDREREDDTMRALLLAPIPRLAVFLGKAIAITAADARRSSWWWCRCSRCSSTSTAVRRRRSTLALVLVLGAIGFAVVGTVFAAMLLRVRSRDVLLPVVLYPILVPLFVAGTKATAALLGRRRPATAWFWTASSASTTRLFWSCRCGSSNPW